VSASVHRYGARQSVRPSDRRAAKALASSHREAIRRRTRRIRRSVAGLAVALFSAAFLVVYVQLASGHDPALVANASRRAGATSTESAAGTGSSGEAGTGESSSSSGESRFSSGESSFAGEESGGGASAVTTSQS
jgi:hypothetical protein